MDKKTQLVDFVENYGELLSGNCRRPVTLSEQQPTLVSHNPVNALMVDLATINLQPGPDPSVAIGGSVFDDAGNGFLQVSVVSLGW
jgi:hypothetical protein